MREVVVAVVIVVAVAATRYLGKLFLSRVIHPVTKDMKADIARMVAEFNPNGGGSMRDRIDRLDRKVSEFIEYQHTRNHDILNISTVLVAREQVRDAGEVPAPIAVDLDRLQRPD